MKATGVLEITRLFKANTFIKNQTLKICTLGKNYDVSKLWITKCKATEEDTYVLQVLFVCEFAFLFVFYNWQDSMISCSEGKPS